jgi:hypothetical protein
LAGLTPHVGSYRQFTSHPHFSTESRVLILTSVRKTSTMFYVEKLFSFLRRHFLQNSLFGFRQLPQLRKSTMVDLEGPPPHLAAASHHKVSCHHCGQVGCRFCSGLCFICFCLLRFASPSSLFALLTHSFFLSSLSFLLLVGCRFFFGSRPRAAPFLGSSPRRCSFSVPFLGLGGAPGGPRFFGLALVLLLGSSPHRLRLGAPHETFGLASVLLFGLASVLPLGSSVLPLGSSVLHTKPAASVPSSASAVLGSSASLRCSSSAPRLRLGAPHETFGLASVLLLGSSVFSLGSSVLHTKPAASVLLLGSLIQ